MSSFKVGDRVTAGGSSVGVVESVSGEQVKVRLDSTTITMPASRLVAVTEAGR